MDMKLVLIIVGIIFLAVSWQISQASGITTSIAGTGVSFLNTAVIGEDKSYSNSLFAEGRSAVIRAIDTRTGVMSDVLVKSSGSFGIDEYGDQTGKDGPDSILNCVFSPVNASGRYSMVSAMGLFQGGEYQSKKQIRDGLRSHTSANATGLVLTKAQSEGENISEYGKTVAVGNMSLVEEIEFTGGVRDD
jgi:hypothetical protein